MGMSLSLMILFYVFVAAILLIYYVIYLIVKNYNRLVDLEVRGAAASYIFHSPASAQADNAGKSASARIIFCGGVRGVWRYLGLGGVPASAGQHQYR